MPSFLPTREELRELRLQWQAARSLLRRAILLVDSLCRMEIINSLRENLMHQRVQLVLAVNNLDSMEPTNHRPLAEEQANLREVEDMVDANIECLNSVIETFYQPLPLLSDRVLLYQQIIIRNRLTFVRLKTWKC